MLDQTTPAPDIHRRNVDWRNLIQKQERSQLPGVDAIVLGLAPEDKPELARVGNHNPGGQSGQPVVKDAVATGCLVADLESLAELQQLSTQLIPSSSNGLGPHMPAMMT